MGHSHDVPARRHFLKLSARLAALGLSSLGLEPARRFFVEEVSGQGRVTDYKALVCVYLFGGNDGNNMIVPPTATPPTRRHAAGAAASPWPRIPCARLAGPAARPTACTRRWPSSSPSTTPATWPSCSTPARSTGR